MILIDYDMLVHRCYRAMDHLHNSKGQATGMEYGVLRSLKSLSKRITDSEEHEVVLCLESRGIKRPDWYKAHRSRLINSFYERKDILLAELKEIYPWAMCPGCEADQAMYTLSLTKTSCFIYTNDSDLFQAISPTTVVVRSFEYQLYYWTAAELFEKLYVKPNQYALYKSLVGDKSDGISGIKRLPRKIAAEMARRAQGYYMEEKGLPPAEALIASLREYKETVSKKVGARFNDFINECVRVNVDLIMLKQDALITFTQPGKRSIQPYLDSLEIRSLRYDEETEF